MSLANPLKTLQIGKDWFPEVSGGLDRYYYDILRHLPSSGVAVKGLVTGTERVSADSGGTVIPFAPTHSSLVTRWLGVRRNVAQELRRERHTLVVAHFALYAVPCLDLLSRSPFVVHFQGPWSDESASDGASALNVQFKRTIERSVYQRAGRFVVLSRAFKQVLQAAHAIPADKVDVIPGGVECARWHPTMTKSDAREQMGWPADRPTVLVVRRLVRRMGLENLIESVAALRQRVPDVLIVIAGKGPLAAELQHRIVSLGVERNVQLAGFVPDSALPTAYRAADLTIVPSVALEGFGLVVVESLSAGTPVLVTNVGGLPETIEQLCPQCVMHEQDPAAIAGALSDALTGVTSLPNESECIAYARAHFDWSIIAERVGNSYRRAVQ